MDQLEREERILEQELEEGSITNQEFTREMNKLHRDYREAARESAQEAYDDELNQW